MSPRSNCLAFLGSFVESLRSDGRFPPKEGREDGGDGDKEPEETLTWTLFLRAQLEERTGFLQEACDTLEVKPRLAVIFIVVGHNRWPFFFFVARFHFPIQECSVYEALFLGGGGIGGHKGVFLFQACRERERANVSHRFSLGIPVVVISIVC